MSNFLHLCVCLSACLYGCVVHVCACVCVCVCVCKSDCMDALYMCVCVCACVCVCVCVWPSVGFLLPFLAVGAGEDRKSVVEGKSVDLCGRRIIKKNNR